MKAIQSSSERGIALIVVLLLMAVLSGLATGFAMTGHVEVQMGTNEINFAGARAAAEAGLNRAIVEIIADTTHDLLKGQDGLANPANNADALNTDNGNVGYLIGTAGPYALGTTGQYTYTIEILDDDNDLLYETPLTAAQRGLMGEDGLIYSNLNDRLVLRATGFGPNGTRVTIGRILETVDTTNVSSTTTTTLANPAILVNGDFEMNGNITVMGTSGSVHANGNLNKTGGSGTITGNATASGTYAGPVFALGATGGGRPTINVPEIHASDYMSIADYKLKADPVTHNLVVQTQSGGVWSDCTTPECKGTGWTYSGGVGGTFSSGSNPTSATYYIEGNVDIGNTSGSTNRAVSVIATGDINVQGGSAELTPENPQKIQFVSDGDVEIVNGSDLDDPTTVEGQILVRGQFEAGGNMEFQGRVMVQDVQSLGNLVANGANRIHGSVKFTYNGSLGAISTTTTTTTTGPTTFVNNISGWMEQ